MNRPGLLPLLVILALTPLPAAAKLATPKPPTPQEQFDALTAKAEGGDAQAQYDLGLAYTEGRFRQKKDEKAAASWMAKSAEGGNAQAQYDLAEIYRLGRGVNPDFAQALMWYEKAADQGRVEASLYMCTAYTQDPTIHADWPRAFRYCQAAKDSPAAQYALGMAYAEGRGTKIDNALALANLKKAGDQGHGAALTELGLIYQIGDLVPQDYAESLILFRKAARRGDRDGIRQLAQQYEAGLGTPVDLGRAARLYEILARDEDDTAARDWLKTHPEAPAVPDALTLDTIPRDIIFYATESNDPRFQTMDIHGYFDQLSISSYPGDAQNDNVGGEAVGECRFLPSGDFEDCVLVKESPANYGFGASLMRIMDRLGSSGNKTDWARRFEGQSIRISMKWKPK